MATADTEWLSTQEASRRLGITTRTLYRFVDQGDLPAYRMGRVIRLKATDVDSFIEELDQFIDAELRRHGAGPGTTVHIGSAELEWGEDE